VFVQRDWLSDQLAQGKSQEEIGRQVGRDGSTIAYWAKKYGLRSLGAERFAARGAPDRDRLEALAASGATLEKIAADLDRSVATVRYWLRKWAIDRIHRRDRTPDDPAGAPKTTLLHCGRHGLTTFRLEGRGSYRCLRCRSERVSEWRRRVKRRLVQEAGGRCALCGYDGCHAALQFHHIDPATKRFEISRRGVGRNIAEAREEARKCLLLCANCHAEVEAGYRRLA
jgi:transposase